MKNAIKIATLFGLLTFALPIVTGVMELQVENPSLVEAVRKGDVDAVRELLNTLGDDAQPGELRQPKDSDYGFTLLHIAAEEDNEEMATFLIGLNGVDPNKINRNEESALHYARSPNMVKLLIENSADINLKNKQGDTPLHIIAGEGHSEAAVELLDRGANASSLNYAKQTPHECALVANSLHTLTILLLHPQVIDNHDLFRPLHKAVIQDEGDEIFDQLLRDGANIDEQDHTGMTPLHWASLKGCISRAEYLLKHRANPNIKERHGITPLYCAVEINDSALLRLLLRYNADKRVRPPEGNFDAKVPLLHEAAQSGYIKSLRVLLDQDEHPDSDRYEGKTLLHFAASSGHLSTVQFLLDAGANPNSLDNYGSTPLYEAAIEGRALVVHLLLTRRAKADSQNKNGRTALHGAALTTHTDATDVVKLLLDAGANVNTQDQDGNTALHGASPRITQQLLDSTLDIDLELENNGKLTPLSLAMQSYKKIEDPEEFASLGIIALPDSRQGNLATTAHLLVAKGADISRLIPLLDSNNYPQTSHLYHQLRTRPYTKRLQALQEYFHGLQESHRVPRDVSRTIAGMLHPPKEVNRLFPT